MDVSAKYRTCARECIELAEDLGAADRAALMELASAWLHMAMCADVEEALGTEAILHMTNAPDTLH